MQFGCRKGRFTADAIRTVVAATEKRVADSLHRLRVPRASVSDSGKTDA